MGNLNAALTQGLRSVLSQCTIQAAKHGGYVVIGSSDYGDGRSALFAGSLEQVLEFVRSQFEGVPARDAARARTEEGFAQAVS